MPRIERDKSPREEAILARLRDLSRELPGAVEAVDGFGHTAFRVGRKPFVVMGATQLHLAVKSDPVTQDALVRTGRFTRTPFLGRHGWISVADFDAMSWEEVEDLVRDAYRMVAPRRKRKESP